MSGKTIELVNDPHLGQYFALKGENSKKAFKNPMASCRVVELRPDDIVADIGAYVGEYSIYAAKRVKKVYSYEASPDTFEVLTKNRRANMEIYHKAVVGGDEETVELYLSKGIGATNSIVKKQSKAGSVKVDAINYVDALKDATVVKIDVEGAEYTYQIIQPQLRAIILEFHPIAGEDWRGSVDWITTQLAYGGFTCLMMPGFTSGWDTNSAWIRDI